MQRAAADGQNEALELRNTVTAMREEMEAMRFDAERRIQAEVASAHGEMAQLQATILALRDTLEAQSARSSELAAESRQRDQTGGHGGR